MKCFESYGAIHCVARRIWPIFLFKNYMLNTHASNAYILVPLLRIAQYKNDVAIIKYAQAYIRLESKQKNENVYNSSGR